MGKKKNKGKKGEEEPEAEGEEAEPEPEEGGTEASAAPTPPPPPPPPAYASDAASKEPPAAPEAGSSVEDQDVPMLRMVVTGTSKTRYIPSVPYCEVTGLPFEFCEFSPLFKKSKENFEQNWKRYFPQVEGEEELAELMARLGFEGGDAASKKAQSTKKSGGEDGGGGGGGKKKEKAPPEIVIELNNRNKKKHITVVKGLDRFDVDTAAAAKTFGKKFACGSALKKAQDGHPESIEIQGNYRDELPGVIVDKLKLKREDIFVLVDGKKIKATDMPGS